MEFRVFILFVFFLFSLLSGISLAQNKVVVIPLVEDEKSQSEYFPSLHGDRDIIDLSITYLEIEVPQLGLVKKLEVAILLYHNCPSDLEFKLWHEPSDKLATLFSNIGGCEYIEIKILLDDEAKTDIKDAPILSLPYTVPNAAINGRYSTGGDLKYFNEIDASGIWRLSIKDNKSGDSGKIYSWGLYIYPSGGGWILLDSDAQPKK